MFSIESTSRGDAIEYTEYTISNIKRKIDRKHFKSAAMGLFLELKHEFETAVVNEPSVFEPLKFYCIPNIKCKTRHWKFHTLKLK